MPRRDHVAQSLGIELPVALRADPRPWHAVVMSHLGRSALARRVELATLHHWTRQTLACGEAPLAVVGTAAHGWVTRACELMGATAVELALAGDSAADQPAHAKQSARSEGIPAQLVSMIDPLGRSLSRDALAIMLADRVDVPWVRPGGTIHKLLSERLAEDRSPSVRVLIPVPHWGQAEANGAARVIGALIAEGAIGYCCRWEVQPQRPPERVAQGMGGAAASASLVQQPHRWLIHWTRGRQGAWPGQSEQQFRDWLLLTRPQTAALSPLVTLKRIVRQRQLVGTSRTVPGGQAVVCFSAVPLLDVVSRRSFRSHLGRWDAEPYGLAIDLAAAKRLGVQRVIYTDHSKKTQVPPAQRWRLQARGRTFDWTAEREWRLPGTADLRSLGPEQVVVFVDRDEEVDQLRGSRWPVVSIGSLRRIASEGVAKSHALG